MKALRVGFAIVLMLCTQACPVVLNRGETGAQKAFNELVFQAQRAEFGINETQKVVTVLFKAGLLQKETALNITDACILANEYIQKIAAVLRMARSVIPGAVTLSGGQRAQIETHLNAMTAAMSFQDTPGISSPALVRLNHLLVPLQQDINGILTKLSTVKTRFGDTTLQVQLTDTQAASLDAYLARTCGAKCQEEIQASVNR